MNFSSLEAESDVLLSITAEIDNTKEFRVLEGQGAHVAEVNPLALVPLASLERCC